MKIIRFEDLECWKESRKITKMVYKITKEKYFCKDYRLKDQITGASISIMNNIAEGFDSQSNFEFIRFLRYSRRSCSEVQNCLYIALDQDYINQKILEFIYNQSKIVRKLVDGLIKYLRGVNRLNR
ncbi:four helix bundle protein [Candidatus Omnitrophota bacterium]